MSKASWADRKENLLDGAEAETLVKKFIEHTNRVEYALGQEIDDKWWPKTSKKKKKKKKIWKSKKVKIANMQIAPKVVCKWFCLFSPFDSGSCIIFESPFCCGTILQSVTN